VSLKYCDDYWILHEYDDKLKTMYRNKNLNKDKQLSNESYLTIHQSIHNSNHKTKLSQIKLINNKSH